MPEYELFKNLPSEWQVILRLVLIITFSTFSSLCKKQLMIIHRYGVSSVGLS